MQEEMLSALKRVVDSGRFILDKEVKAFEDEFAIFCNTNYCVGVGNGTDALYLALKAINVGSRDEVITVSHTASATSCAIKMTGATPVYIDIEERSMLMNPDLIEKAITPKTKAIIPVHLYGRMCNMIDICYIASKYNISIVEDCAQSIGAGYLYGNIGCYSFYPTKNLGAIGDGGCIVTNNKSIADKIKQMREYGFKDRFISDIDGINSRLDEIQAAVLRVKLKYLSIENKRRRELATTYIEELKDTDLILPELKGTFHQFVVRSKKRDKIVKLLNSQIHYPVPCHLQPAYITNDILPITEKICKEIVSLPMKVSIEEAKEICNNIKGIL